MYLITMNLSEVGLSFFRCVNICSRLLAMLLQQNAVCLHHGDPSLLLSKKMTYSEVGQFSVFLFICFFLSSQMMQDTG